jgi:hypothetical protein
VRLAALSVRLSHVFTRSRGEIARPKASAPDPVWSVASDPNVELFEALNHVLRLSDLLPAGVSGDRVRRCVCELIEAGTGADRDARLAGLVNSITDLQHNESSRRPGEGGMASVIELLSAVRSEVIPVLQPGRASVPGRLPGVLATAPSLGTKAEAEEDR